MLRYLEVNEDIRTRKQLTLWIVDIDFDVQCSRRLVDGVGVASNRPFKKFVRVLVERQVALSPSLMPAE